MSGAPTRIDRVRGCLLGGAVGDALGAAVEFLSLAEIRDRFGAAGIAEFAPAYGRVGAITDDTQMTLFTAEGLLRAWGRPRERRLHDAPGLIRHAYLRWLLTQRERLPGALVERIGGDGWLFALPALHHRRGPGQTCRAALRGADLHGPDVARNDSKGCGGVMRVAPVGLFAPAVGDDHAVFTLGADSAALTHGHPSGFLAAGHLAVVIAALLRADSLNAALDAADAQLRSRDRHDEVLRAVAGARALAAAGRPTAEALESLGGGWVGEEALAIGICCALAAADFADGVRLGANHSGDSDSTAAIAGSILGARLGAQAIPRHFLDQLELRAEITRLADDLDAVASGAPADPDRYPGW